VAAGVVALLVALVLVSAVAAIFLDLASYTATGNQTLSSPGASVGRALVVYDPGLSGSAQRAAEKIAADLQQKGYVVDLAGVRSKAATNASAYDIVVAGGPMYFAKATGSIEGFLKALTPQQQGKLGVFVTTGSSLYVDSDFVSLQGQVASATDTAAAIAIVLDGNETQNCADLVSSLTQ
jgi:flavodoxin